MSRRPLVSVITPTWGRREALLNRCVPSVQLQSYPVMEHVVAIDGPDWELAEILLRQGIRHIVMPVHDPRARWGHWARLAGICASRGEFVAYLDDDDEWTPDHLHCLVGALLRKPEAGFAFPRMRAHMADGSVARVGDGHLARGRIATSMIMHRRELLDISTWQNEPAAPDWGLVSRWLDAGVEYASVDAETVDYYPARPVDPAKGVYVSFAPHGGG